MFYGRGIRPSNWDRFAHYAGLVHVLKLWSCRISPNIIIAVQTLAWTRDQSIFPNLRRLEQHADDDLTKIGVLGMYLQPGLRHIVLQTPSEFSPENGVVMVQLLARHAPQIETVEWLTAMPLDSDSEEDDPSLRLTVAETNALSLAISKLIHLTKVTWPSKYLIPLPVWKAFGSLPELHVISGVRSTYAPSNIIFYPHSFPSLKIISGLGLYPQMMRALFSSTPPLNLEGIMIRVIDGDVADIKAFVDLSTRHIAGLKRFGIIWDGSGLIGMEALKGLISTSTLTSVKMRLDIALGLGDSEVAELGRDLPNLEILELSPDPICSPDDASLLTLNVLEDLAQSCPKLESLALFVITDQSVLGAARRVTTPPYPFCPFSKPLRINFGLSHIRTQDVIIIALWLSAMCTDQTGVCSEAPAGRGPYASVQNIAPGIVERAEAAESQWDAVAEALLHIRRHTNLIASITPTRARGR